MVLKVLSHVISLLKYGEKIINSYSFKIVYDMKSD